MNNTYKYLLGLVLVSLLFITGCGGSSQGIISPERPEEVVFRTTKSWRASDSSPKYGDIKLYDLASNSYILTVTDVKIVDTEATVVCSFNYTATVSGYLNLVFSLVFDEGKWWFDDVVITDYPREAPGEAPGEDPGEDPGPVPPTPEGNGITGVVKDQNGNAIGEATIMVYSVTDLNTVVASAVTDSKGEYLVKVGKGEYIVIATKGGYTISQAYVLVGEVSGKD